MSGCGRGQLAGDRALGPAVLIPSRGVMLCVPPF